MTNENNISKIENEVVDAIRVSLRLNVMEGWKLRHLPFSRTQLKNNLKALRVIRNTQYLYQEKFFWTK